MYRHNSSSHSNKHLLPALNFQSLSEEKVLKQLVLCVCVGVKWFVCVFVQPIITGKTAI